MRKHTYATECGKLWRAKLRGEITQAELDKRVARLNLDHGRNLSTVPLFKKRRKKT